MESPMFNALSASCDYTVEFYDVDPMNVVWHGNYIRFFEMARSVLLDQIQYNYDEMKASGYVWPVVDFRIKYIRPMFLRTKYRIEATLVEFENRMKINYQIKDFKTHQVLTKATSIQVAIKEGQTHMEFATPKVFQDKVNRVILCN